MNFPPGSNPKPGYYNISGAFIINPQPIEPQLDNNFQEIGLYLKNAGLMMKHFRTRYLPFPNNLTEIICVNNQLTQLPELPDSVTWINCSFNQIEQLPELPPSLINLDCDNNQLKQLPNLQNTSLEMINCSRNLLTELPALPNSLVSLDCGNNKLNTLPELPNTLRNLKCRGNDFDNNTVDRIIQFYRNAIQQEFENNSFISFQMELAAFIRLQNFKTSQSVSVVHSLTTGRLVNEEGELKEKESKKQIPRVMIGKINEYANLRKDVNPFNVVGGKRKNKKKTNRKRNTKKTKKSKKNKTKRKRYNDMKTKN
jgi:hypothetical protein